MWLPEKTKTSSARDSSRISNFSGDIISINIGFLEKHVQTPFILSQGMASNSRKENFEHIFSNGYYEWVYSNTDVRYTVARFSGNSSAKTVNKQISNLGP